MSRYSSAYRHAIDQPAQFWGEQAQRIPWFTPPTTLLDYDAQGHARWFVDGEMNTCHAALDHHVENGRGDQPAVLWDSPVTASKARYSYREMRDEVARLAGALVGLGVSKGDRVVIYMPMVPEALMAMYACARLGAVHSVVFGGFAPHELAVRIDDAEPKVVLAASCGVEVDRVIAYKPILDAALALSEHRPEACVILQRDVGEAELGALDHDWRTLVAEAAPADCVAVKASDPLYILYTSGTTGKPKGVVRDNGGYAVALHYSMEVVYGMQPGEVFCSASDVGWVVGHSYIVYAPLLAGCTTLVYEGKPVRTPDSGAFWRLIEEYRVKVFLPRPRRFARSRRRIRKGAGWRVMTSPRCAPCSWPANVSIRRPFTGLKGCSRYRWSTTGGRLRPAGRSLPTCRAWRRYRPRPARRPIRCRGSTCGSSAPRASRPGWVSRARW